VGWSARFGTVSSDCQDVSPGTRRPVLGCPGGQGAAPGRGGHAWLELVSISPEQGTIEVAFTATEAFLNPAGVIQGGFLSAMLDDTLAPALVAGLGPGDFARTTDLHVQFLRPALVACSDGAALATSHMHMREGGLTPLPPRNVDSGGL